MLLKQISGFKCRFTVAEHTRMLKRQWSWNAESGRASDPDRATVKILHLPCLEVLGKCTPSVLCREGENYKIL